MKYHLSGKQLKEIDHGTGLLIAIPVPIEPVEDTAQYARASLAVPAEWIRSVQAGEIDVDPVTTVGAAEILPSIVVAGRVAANQLTLRVLVYAILVAAGDRRRTTAKIQWPGGEIER